MPEDPRLSALEEAAAHSVKALDEVSAETAEQWEAIRRLEGKIDMIITYLKQLREEQAAAQGDGTGEMIERPPHY